MSAQSALFVKVLDENSLDAKFSQIDRVFEIFDFIAESVLDG